VVEVLSPGSEAMDFITKRDGYEKRGIREYWFIDPADGRVRAWRLERGRLIESLVEGPRLTSFGIPGFSFDIGQLQKVLGSS
jgi:Uma2 family endonuclease